MKTEEIKAQLGQIYDPVRHGTLAELNAIKYVGFNDEKDSVVLIVEVKDTTSKETDILKRQLAKVVKIDLGYSGIKIQLEESKTSANVGGKDTKYLFITSTKGGVGRSTVAINLAYCLKEKGYKADKSVYEKLKNFLKGMEEGNIDRFIGKIDEVIENCDKRGDDKMIMPEDVN